MFVALRKRPGVVALILLLALLAAHFLPSPSALIARKVPSGISDSALGQEDERPPVAQADAAVGSAFTYEGQLHDGGAPVDGACDFEFTLFDAAVEGAPVGDSVMLSGHLVSEGRFSAPLDFGPGAFSGDARWLEIGVRCPAGAGQWTTLSPRQALTAAPYALGLRPGAIISGTVTGGVLTVENATGHGMAVPHAGSDGLRVDSAGFDGVRVVSAGSTGLQVDTADGDGVFVGSAGDDGVSVYTASNNGLEVHHATNNGMFVCATGIENTCTPTNASNGVEVGNAEDDGLSVQESGSDGVYVGSAGDDGVRVVSAGHSGIRVGAAEEHGILVVSAGLDGVRVEAPGHNGVNAATRNADAYGGRFLNKASSGSGAGLYAQGNTGTAPDIVLGANGSGLADDDGRIVSDPAFEGSDIRFFTNDNFWIDLDESGTHSGSNFTIRNSDNQTVWAVDENGDVTTAGTTTTRVDAGARGQLELYALQSDENRFEDFGAGSLVDGEATVPVDPAFAAAVKLDGSYHVFLTPLGDCALYVAQKTAASFRVRAQDGAACSIDFDYRIVATRAAQ